MWDAPALGFLLQVIISNTIIKTIIVNINNKLFETFIAITTYYKRAHFIVYSIVATTVIDDVTLIYCYCVVYGICLGLIMTSEYLMFIECFGSQRFPHAYGFVNLCKIVVIVVLGVIAINPLSVYQYPIHPLDQDDTPRNSSSFDLLGCNNISFNFPSITLLHVL